MDIEAYKSKIEKEIEKYFNNIHLPTTNEVMVNAINYLKEFTLRPAKRLRPLLMIAAYKCFKNDDKIVLPSLCIELMQSSLLIHDDIMDGDEVRRGGKTIHKIYEESGGEDYGVAMGINLGDLSAILMFEAINQSDFNMGTKFEAYNKVIEIYKKEVCGQILDVNNLLGMNPTLKGLEEIYLLKTVPYTTIGPLELGCIFAHGDYVMFGYYGINLGLAFQIKDDLLGIFGDSDVIGKSSSIDLKNGKMTYPILYTLENCNKRDKETIIKALGEKDINKNKLGLVKKIIKDTALDEMNRIISINIEQAKSSLSPSLRKDGLETLILIADIVGNRNN